MPALALSTGTVVFAATQAGAALPVAKTVAVTSSGGGTLATPTLSVTYDGVSGWLDHSVTASGAGYTVTLRPNSTALTATTHTATVQVTCAGATGSPTVSVSWEVTASSNPVIAVSPAGLAFTGQIGLPDPAPKTITLSNGGTGTLAQATVSESAGWLTATISGNTITVGASVGALPADPSYTGTITITSAGADNSPLSYPVTFTVDQPAMQVAPAGTLSFATVVGVSPAAQTLTVSNTGTGTLAMPSVSDDAAWLSATVSGSGPTYTVSVSVNAAGLAAGPYGALLTVTSPGATGSPATRPVSLLVNPPSDPIPPALSAAPSTLSFSTIVGSSPAGKTVTITNLGPGTLATPSVSDDASWLSATVSGADPTYTVNVAVNAAALAAGTYGGTITLTIPGFSSSPTVPVTLIVNASSAIDTSTIVTAYETILAKFFQRETECFKWSSRLPAYLGISDRADSLGAAEAAGRLTYVRSQADVCAAAVSSATCAELDDLTACDSMVAGRVANGQPCYADEECANGHCTSYTLSCPGTCTAFRSAGDVCGEDEDCGPGKQCIFDGLSSSRCTVVETPGAQGAACAVTSPECQPGLYCQYDPVARTSSCVPRKGLDGSCSADATCDAALACNVFLHTCQERAGLGESCSTAVCGMLLTCSFSFADGSSKCAEIFPIVGESCSQNRNCLASYCDVSLMCAEGTVPAGGTCDATRLCVHGADCIGYPAGTCVDRPTLDVCY